LVSHLQGISEELALIGSISGIDVVIAGGGDEILDSGDTSNLLPSDTGNVFDTYPIVIQDELNEDVYVVTTPGNYRYLGRLEIDFDAEGKVISVGDNSELVRNARVDGLVQDPNTLTNVVEPVEDFIANAVVIAESQVELDTSRPNIRVIQTNIGSISADAFKAAAEAKANTLGLSDDYIIALTNGGGIRTDRLYPSGDLTDQTLANIFPFGNTVNAITGMTTAQLLSVLEHSVAAVEGVSGQWGQISGFTFSYDPTQQGQTTVETSADSGVFEIDTPGGRILDVYLEDGTQIISDGGITAEASSLTYTFVTNDFILDNGDRYPLGTFSGDTYTPFTNVVIEDFGDVNGSGSITYADVAQWYITNLANIADTSLPDITTSHYGPAAVVNRVVAIDPVLGSDLDGDGINDEWEQLIIGFAGNDLIDGIDDVNATTDFDDDGILDIDEFTNGTDPTVETETVVTFPIVASGFIGNDFFIDVEDGVFGKKVTSSDDLVLPFTDISNISIVVDDNNEFNRFIIPASELNSDKDFFRVEESEIILLR